MSSGISNHLVSSAASTDSRSRRSAAVPCQATHGSAPSRGYKRIHRGAVDRLQVNGGWRQVPLELDDHEPPVRAKAQDVEPVAEGLAGCRLPLVELARDYSYP